MHHLIIVNVFDIKIFPFYNNHTYQKVTLRYNLPDKKINSSIKIKRDSLDNCNDKTRYLKNESVAKIVLKLRFIF